jgi:rSAM/selenodomain-associated transferase 2/rSAM/selenodomain-associated transferase 1
MRYPEPGRVKTRLAAGLGVEQATAFYEQLLRRTLGVVADFACAHQGVRVFLYFDPIDKEAAIRRSCPGPWQLVPQSDGHLGDRMLAAFRLGQTPWPSRTVIIGTDIADLESVDLEDAFRVLEDADAVVGPAADGGFYLMGLNQVGVAADAALAPTVWGSADVCRRTVEILRQGGSAVALVTKRTDIDRADDIERLASRHYFQHRLSVIVPTVKPVAGLQPFLDELEAQLWPTDEIIVVQGRDLADEEVHRLSARTRVVSSCRGRGRQLNRGVRESRGDLLWFLHADSLPPSNFAYHIRKLTIQPGLSLGCFRLAFPGINRALTLIARWANWRTRFLKLPYGDQGLFCRRETFDRLGGFSREYLMEDVDFVRAARRLGKLLSVEEVLTTSPDRYERRGVLRASLSNHLLFALYQLGVGDHKLYSLYYRL